MQPAEIFDDVVSLLHSMKGERKILSLGEESCMSASIHFLHRKSAPIASYLRLGRSGHRMIEHAISAGRFPYQRVIFEAGHIDAQNELVQCLRERGAEIILDTNFSELCAAGKCNSQSLQNLPWSESCSPTTSERLDRFTVAKTAKQIADFAIERRVDAVLSPCHYMNGISDPRRLSDLDLCHQLRLALDSCGGDKINISYQVIADAKTFNSQASRQDIIEPLHSMPIDGVWLRITGFGAGATGCATRNMIDSSRDFHTLEKPIIADYAGGFAALGAAAFGSIGGISHGLAQKESFRGGYEWRTPPKEAIKSGAQKRIYFPDLDRYMNEGQTLSFLSAKGAKSRFCCNDVACCQHGMESMCRDPQLHFLYQRSGQINSISSVSEARRGEHFLSKHLDSAIRSIRIGSKLTITDNKIRRTIEEARVRLERMRDALADLQEHDVEPSRSRSPSLRSNPPSATPMHGV